MSRTIKDYLPAGPVIRDFHESNAFVRGIRGPIGSGKTTACLIEILSRACEQLPFKDNVRYTRWVVVRNTMPDLKGTTLKAWHQWVPKEYGRFTMDSPITHRLDFPLDDGTRVNAEVIFLALDHEKDIRKLMSLEVTGAFFNEARYIPGFFIGKMVGRLGRYPGEGLGGTTWRGIFMDTNPPDTENWWYRAFEEGRLYEEDLVGWKQFVQPSGLSEEAENLHNIDLGRQYYINFAGSNSKDDVNVYVHGNYGFVKHGKVVYPEYSDSFHIAKKPLYPIQGRPIIIGADGGLTPSAVFCQREVGGRWLILREIVADNMGGIRMGELIARTMAENYPGYEAMIWGDPAGMQRSQIDEQIYLEILQKYSGIVTKPAPSNSINMRIEAVRNALTKSMAGDPMLVIDPSCKVLRKGFNGGYCYKQMQLIGQERYHDAPDKNGFSHVHDALQYAMLGGGEASVVLKNPMMNGDFGKLVAQRNEYNRNSWNNYDPLR